MLRPRETRGSRIVRVTPFFFASHAVRFAHHNLRELNSGGVANYQRHCFSVSIKISPSRTRFKSLYARGAR
jgi:hypothetical protein